MAYAAEPDTLGPDTKKLPLKWQCSCGSPNDEQSSRCANCGAMKGNAKIINVGNRSLRKGEKPEGYMGAVLFPGQPPTTATPAGPTPPGHKLMQRAASAPVHESPLVDDVEDDEDGLEDDVEFKQERGVPGAAAVPADQRLRRLVERHDARARSFHALFGGPETDYAGSGASM